MYKYTEANTEVTTMKSTYKEIIVQSTASQLPVEAQLPSGLCTYLPPCRDPQKTQ